MWLAICQEVLNAKNKLNLRVNYWREPSKDFSKASRWELYKRYNRCRLKLSLKTSTISLLSSGIQSEQFKIRLKIRGVSDAQVENHTKAHKLIIDCQTSLVRIKLSAMVAAYMWQCFVVVWSCDLSLKKAQAISGVQPILSSQRERQWGVNLWITNECVSTMQMYIALFCIMGTTVFFPSTSWVGVGMAAYKQHREDTVCFPKMEKLAGTDDMVKISTPRHWNAWSYPNQDKNLQIRDTNDGSQQGKSYNNWQELKHHRDVCKEKIFFLSLFYRALDWAHPYEGSDW